MLGYRWYNLSRTATIPYNGDPLACVDASVVPFRSVEDCAFE